MTTESRLENKIIRLVGKAYYKKYYDNHKYIKEMIDYLLSVDLSKLFNTISRLETELDEKEIKKEKKTEKAVKPVQEKKRFEEKKVNKLIDQLDKIDNLTKSKSEFNFFDNKRK